MAHGNQIPKRILWSERTEVTWGGSWGRGKGGSSLLLQDPASPSPSAGSVTSWLPAAHTALHAGSPQPVGLKLWHPPNSVHLCGGPHGVGGVGSLQNCSGINLARRVRLIPETHMKDVIHP